MKDLLVNLSRIRKKIRKSSGCSYLYTYFDELVEALEQRKEALSSQETDELKDLINDYAKDSRYNNFASANWMRYSARCFYCADYLVRYLPNERERESMTHFLNLYFVELIEHGVAPIIPQEKFDKYFIRNLKPENHKSLYDTVVRKAVGECGRCRYWRSNEITLALAYTKAADRLIREYTAKYSDFSMLKEWLPLLGTTRLANFWYEYPDSANHSHSSSYEGNAVMEASDEMLDIHLKLLNLWYWHNPQEVIETLPMEDMIEALEVSEDDEFEKILRHITTLPFNEKVEGILKHFTHDDEAWIVILSRQLLNEYSRK